MTNQIFKAEYADFKNVKTRSAVQFIFEVPVEQANHIIQMIGMPNPAEPQWFGIAKLNSGHASQQTAPGGAPTPPPVPSQKWGELSYVRKAGIRSTNAVFWDFIQVENEQDAAEFIRQRCKVSSRSEIDGNPDAMAAFDFLDKEFQGYLEQVKEEQRGRG